MKGHFIYKKQHKKIQEPKIILWKKKKAKTYARKNQ